VRLVIVGGPRLEERLASPKLESFNQRIAARCYLQAFNYDETANYIYSQIAAVGGVAERVFASDAASAVYRATDGIPRLINQVCDHALVLAIENGVRQITTDVVEVAWSDLQQLPTPWNSAAGAQAASEAVPDIIEFGTLEDVEPRIMKPAERSMAPKLHAARSDNRSHLFGASLERKLDAIEATIDSVQQNDKSPAIIAPDPDDVPAVDPFAEPFINEEVVVDRLASLETNVLANRRLVRSEEGRELSSLLERHQGGVQSNFATSEGRISSRDTRLTGVRPADDPVLPDDPTTLSVMMGASADEPLDDLAIGMGFSGDESYPELDLIVVDDDPPDPPPPSSGPRREGVQQVFTRLRRG
jgi:hypothetical protein